MKRLFILSLLFCVLSYVWSAGQAEESAASGKYFAERGLIIPPEHIRIDSYIATYKYNYPYSEEEIGVYLYSGHRQISNSGQEEVLQIGIQAKRTPFEELPTLNIVNLARSGGGSSRFIADKERMQRMFGSELDRMMAPIAYDIEKHEACKAT